MVWVIVGLLAVVILLLGIIAFIIDHGNGLLVDLVRASGQANIRELQNISAKLDEIERHTKLSARPFYEAEEERRRDPEKYPYD